MTDFATLLEPVADGAPAGADLSYDRAMLDFDIACRGKPETAWSAAEDPDWSDVRRRGIALLSRTKDLRVAVWLSMAALKLEGLPGLADGLELVAGMLERYWPGLYPSLDADEDDDPTERLSVLNALVATSADGYLQFRGVVRQVVLAGGPRTGRITLADLQGVDEGKAKARSTGTGDEVPPLDAQAVHAAFSDTPTEQLHALAMAAARAGAAVAVIDATLAREVGSGRAPDLTPLRELLEEIVARLGRVLAPRGDGGGNVSEGGPRTSGGRGNDDGFASGSPRATGGPGASNGNHMNVPGMGAAGPMAIRSHDDVLEAIDRICDFYARHEPASPVPLLLRRARRLVARNFLDIIRDLSPDAMRAIELIAGPDEEEAKAQN